MEELELPFLRHGLQTTRSVIDFCEGIGNVEARIVGKNNGLNAHLERSQKADIPGLQSLVRDRLHLVWVCLDDGFLCILILKFAEISYLSFH